MNFTAPTTDIQLQTIERDENLSIQNDEFTDKIIEENNIKISLVPSKRKKVKKINMNIEGDFTINNVQMVKENCQKLLQHFDLVNINLKNILDIDLAAIQLLQVLNTSSSFLQKTIIVESELSKDDRALIVSAGLMEVMTKQK